MIRENLKKPFLSHARSSLLRRCVTTPKGLAKLGNIVAETLFPDMFPCVVKLRNIRFKSKICVCEAKIFLTCFRNINFLASKTQNMLPQHMFLARLNWETFASAAMLPQQCFLVKPGPKNGCIGDYGRSHAVPLSWHAFEFFSLTFIRLFKDVLCLS